MIRGKKVLCTLRKEEKCKSAPKTCKWSNKDNKCSNRKKKSEKLFLFALWLIFLPKIGHF